ncbi:MAG TPA: hypothetical protein VGK24_10375 [Candidatus Angelobacter sp.]|jgi:hypothetical protein
MSTIHIDRKKGARITKIQPVPLKTLKLDSRNVRFCHIDKVLKDKDMEKLIRDEPETKNLMKAVIASGGLSTRPVVTQQGIVKEGNRRIVCLRKILDLIDEGELPELKREDFEEIECEVLPEEITQREVDIYLGRVHVSGVKEWDAINQAQHIWTLYHESDLSIDDIRDYLGLGKGTILQKLRALEWTSEFIKEYPDKAGIRNFSFFEELYKKKSLREWIDNDPSGLKLFFKWVAGEKFDETGAKDVRRLPDIMAHKEAWKLFQAAGGKFSTALRKVYEGRPELTSSTFEAVKTANEALKNIGLEEYKSIPRDSARLEMLSELHQRIQSMLKEFSSQKTAAKRKSA